MVFRLKKIIQKSVKSLFENRFFRPTKGGVAKSMFRSLNEKSDGRNGFSRPEMFRFDYLSMNGGVSAAVIEFRSRSIKVRVNH